MKKMILKVTLSAIFSLVSAFILAFGANAADITDRASFSVSTGADPSKLTDGSINAIAPNGYYMCDAVTLPAGGYIDVTSAEPVTCVYVKFYTRSAKWTLSSGDSVLSCGENGYLHEAVMTDGLTSFRMTFPDGGTVSEIELYSQGELPAGVQVWTPECERADILLYSTHSDDEHLFFAGILPYYTSRENCEVQVVYLIDHSINDPVRAHELLEGLWTAGVRHYPLIGPFPDLYSESLDAGFAVFGNAGYSREDFEAFTVSLIRRFRPQVIVGHDIDGEYGHGSHIINTNVLMSALEISNDPQKYPESAAKYGVWDVPKTYLHLYGENKIVMNWDVPLDAFGGKTAYQVSCDAYLCHKSQHWMWFYNWMLDGGQPFASVFMIDEYSPCNFGLYRSTVGADFSDGEMLDNIVLYAEQDAGTPPDNGYESDSEGDSQEDPTETQSEAESETDTEAAANSSDGNSSDIDTAVIISVSAVIAVSLIIVIMAVLPRNKPKRKRR